MYKILYLTQFSEIGGGETILISLLKNLDRKKFEPIVVVPKRGQLSQRLIKLKITTYYLELNPYLIRTFFIPGASPSLIYRFARLTNQLRPSLIHINHLTLAIYAGIAAKMLHIPLVATSHGTWDSIYFYQDLVNQLFADKILANAPKTAKSLLRRKIVNPKKVRVVPFGIDTDVFKPGDKSKARKKLKLPLNDLIVTIVGRIDPVKDHLTFLNAAEIIQKKIKNVTFYVVGSQKGNFARDDTYNQKIAGFLSQNPTLKRKVIFSGFVDNMPTVYQASDIVVSTSLSESFGLTLAECLSCAIPVIATNVGNQNQIVKNGQSGDLVPPKQPTILAQKIISLLKNPNRRNQFGQFGRKYIVNNFSIKKFVARIQEEYIKIEKSMIIISNNCQN